MNLLCSGSDKSGNNYVNLLSVLKEKTTDKDFTTGEESPETDKIVEKLKTAAEVAASGLEIEEAPDIEELYLDAEGIAEQEIKNSRRKKNGVTDIVQAWAEKFKETHDIRLWEKIQTKLWPGLVAHCYKVTRNYEVAEDVASVILMRAYERIDDYDIMKAKFGSWVWCIGFRQACRDLMLEKRQPAPLSSICNSDDSLENYVMGVSVYTTDESKEDITSCGLFADREDVEHGYENSVKVLYDASIVAIQNLTPQTTRDVVTLKLLENKTIAQISTMLNMTPSNVKNHLYKAKKQIADFIKTDKSTSESYHTYIEAGHIING